MSALAPAYEEPRVVLYQADCLEVMRALPEESVDAVVTDPPYSLRFMGRDWDNQGSGADIEESHRPWVREALRVLKPGGHLLAFGGTRTHHRLMCALEDAGFEVRDCLMFLHGQGFPKSLDVSKAIDKAAGAERKVTGQGRNAGRRPNPIRTGTTFSDDACVWGQGDPVTHPATDAARQWSGWGTALKPAWEPIILARKPLSGPTVANLLLWGTGALNVDECRIAATDNVTFERGAGERSRQQYRTGTVVGSQQATPLGRWPANVLLSHAEGCERVGTKRVPGSRIDTPSEREFEAFAGGGLGGPRPARGVGDAEGMETIEEWRCVEDCPVRLLDEQSGERPSTLTGRANSQVAHVHPAGPERVRESAFGNIHAGGRVYAHIGGASRFFYTAKADQEDRAGSRHPTVKPTDLCKWLVALVTPPGGTVLDPFMGSGPIVWAARELGFRAVGVDREAEYVQDAVRRLQQQVLWGAEEPPRPVERVDLPEPEQLGLEGEAT